MAASSGDEPLTRCQTLLQWIRAVVTFLVSNIGLCGLVVGYSFVGGLTFRELEAPEEMRMKTAMMDKEWNVTVFLWNQTSSMEVLHKVNWTLMATRALRDFQNDLVDAVRKQGYDGSPPDTLQWTLPGAILYSIIVITTIGYGNVAPKTDWGKIVTIVYAIVGIPLMLLCMSNIGDVMAHSFKFLYWKVCCYFCAKPKRPRRTRSSVRSRKGGYPSTRNRPGSRRHPSYADGRPPSNTTSRTSSYRSGRSNPEDEYDSVHDDMYGGGHSLPSPNPWTAIEVQPGFSEVQRPMLNSKYGTGSKEDLRVDLLSPGMERKSSSRYSRQGSRRGHTKEEYMVDEVLEDVEEMSDDEDEEAEVSPDRPVPIWLCVALVSGYLCGGAAIFRFWEDWEFFDSFYFCFITLTTIGFGDFVPGNTVTENSQVTLSLCAVYLLFGMALLAMSFNLVQEQVTSSVKSLGKRIGIIGDDEDDAR